MCVCVLHGCVCVFPCARDREPVCEFYIYIKKESATRMHKDEKKSACVRAHMCVGHAACMFCV